MELTYDEVASFAQTWGMVYMVILFVGLMAYALWPRNKEKFDHAARMPLDEEK
jgi:cytochrome c oxidase cbb3-type subunit 4